jgi:hypothetical protein
MNDMTALRIIEIETLRDAQEQFITAEQAVLACEKNFHEWQALDDKPCFIQSSGKNRWRIVSKNTPKIEIQVLVDSTSGQIQRLNWRQDFE